ncbi:hypothetical protein ACLKA7_010344 [Drosophila subpalustris]
MIVRFECESGYILYPTYLSSSDFVCRDKIWNSKPPYKDPSCVKFCNTDLLSCRDSMTPECYFNGIRLSQSKCYGSGSSGLDPSTQVKLKCKPGFRGNRNQSNFDLECQEDGNWRYWNKTNLDNYCTLDCGELEKQGLSRNTVKFNPVYSPWSVALFFRNEINANYKYICGGVLIRHNLVLTAAHCVCMDKTRTILEKGFFRVGPSNSLNSTVNSTFGWTVKKISINPQYVPYSFKFDTALIHIEEHENLTFPIICLPWLHNITKANLKRSKPISDATSSSKCDSECEGSDSKPRLKYYKKDNVLKDNTLKVKSSASADHAVLWQNLRHVLSICGGKRKPLTIKNTEWDLEESGALVNVLEAQRFVSDVFAAMQVPFKAASEMADALIAADYMGQRSMGIHRLPSIAAELINLRVDPQIQPKVLCEREAMALVDGQNAPGPVVGNFCMDLAMVKARDQGIGLVAARRSNNIGMASWYACQALSQRMIGLCMSNGLPVLVPSGGIEPLLGANSIACAATSAQEQFLLDMGMSAYPIEQLELDYCNGHLQQLPPQVALDCNGRPTTSATDALQAQRLRPFSPEHKGFGLAAMVDVLCGVMTGARYASQLAQSQRGLFYAEDDIADLGQVFIVIDPMRFCVSFEERLSDFHQLLRNVLPCNPNQPPLIPGDRERQHMQMVDDQGGLILSPCTLYVLQELSERFNISPIKSSKRS